MKKYLIDTTNSTEQFVVETEEDLINQFNYYIRGDEKTMRIKHRKELTGLGTYEYTVLLNLQNVVSITTSEKV